MKQLVHVLGVALVLGNLLLYVDSFVVVVVDVVGG